VEFHDGLEVIEKQAFYKCRLLHKILIPPSVRVIEDSAFNSCSGLTTMILNNGLVEIRKFAFYDRKSLVCVDVPPNVRAIKKGAFYGCLGLTIGILSDGLEEIGEYAFAYCQSLVHIDVPFNVRVNKERGSLRLHAVDNCNTWGKTGGGWEVPMHFPACPSYASTYPPTSGRFMQKPTRLLGFDNYQVLQ
jgi:hypothetical protein